MKSRAANNINAPTGDGSIDSQHSTSLTYDILIQNTVGNTGTNAGIQWVQVFAQDANRQKLTFGVYGAALLIMMDFVLRYPLYADASYFQINDGKYGTLGNGYIGLGLNGLNATTTCYLKGNPAQNNGLVCAMPSDYPDN